MAETSVPPKHTRPLAKAAPAMHRWIIVVGLSLTVLTWLAAYQVVRQDYDSEVQRTQQIQSHILKSMDFHLTDMFKHANYVLLLMKSSVETTGGITPEIRVMLSSSIFAQFTGQATVIDHQGNVSYSFTPGFEGISLADRPHFQTHIVRDSGEVFLGPVVTGRISGRPSFHLSRRVNRPDGSFGGVVSIAFVTDYFTEIFQQMNVAKTNFLLVGSDGIIRAISGDNQSLLGRSLVGGPLLQVVESNGPTGMYLGRTLYQQEYRFVSYLVTAKHGLILAVSQLEADALDRFYARRNVYYGAAASVNVSLFLLMILLFRASRRQDELRRSAQSAMERAEYYLDMAGSLLVALDLSGRITMLNPLGCEILGYTEEELLEKDWFETILPPENRDYVRMRFRQMVAGESLPHKRSADMGVLTRDGSRRIISWMNSVLKNHQGDVIGTLSSGVDVTERRRLEAELLRLAHTDPLTGLNNRRSILAAGEREFQLFRRYQRPLSAGMMDIDHFKQVNDKYGHAAGDEVLKVLASICRHTLRNVDLYGRFGGEEFLFLLPETPGDKAIIVAERLRKALEETVVRTAAGDEIRFTVSIGLATTDPSDNSLEDLIHVADANLYVAKNSGRNRVVGGFSARNEPNED